MPSATKPVLSEHAIDDILYFARADELNDLTSILSSLASTHKCSIRDILSLALDPGSGSSALHMACANNYLEIVKYLLGALSTSPSSSHPSALVDTPNVYGNTPLHYAAVNGHLDIVKLLVAAGANTNLKNHASHDAVFEAETSDKTEVVEWLLNQMNNVEGEGKESMREGVEDDSDMKMERKIGLEQGIEQMDISEMP
ncbi:Ankyrin-2 [Varicellaria rhodocarpa]|nr:Ankyrin-2 [Varicellaria rhodocarpa]